MLPPIRIKIGADAEGLDAVFSDVAGKLNRLEGQTDKVASGFKNFGDGANRAGRRLLPLSAGVTAAAGSMVALARNTSRAGDEIAKSARAAGVSADALQELRFALGQAAGVGDEQTTAMLGRLTRNMGEAVSGNKDLTSALESLGFSLEDIADGTVETDQVFGALMRAMQDAPTSAEAAAMGMELLGREGAALGGKLRESGSDIDQLRARANELGIVLSGDTLNASEQFGDKMDELQKQLGAAKNQIGAALIPVALALATTFQERVVPAIVSVAEGIAKAIEWFGQLPGPAQDAAAMVAAALGVGGPILLAVGAMAKAFAGIIAATGPVGLFIAAASLAYAAWQIWGDDIKALIGTVSEAFTSNFGGMIEAGSILFDGITRQAQNFIDLVTAIFTGDLEGVMNSTIDIFTSPLRTIVALWESDFAAPIREGVTGVTDWFKTGFTDLLVWFGELHIQFFQYGRDIIAGLWNGLKAAWDEFSIVDTVSGWAGGIKDSFAGMLGIKSPSRVFQEYGMNIGEGLRNGITDSFGMVQSAVAGLADTTTSGAFDMAKGVVDAMGHMFKGSKPIAMAQALINTFQGMTEALKLPFPGNLLAVAKVAASGFAAVQGISSANPGSGAGAGRAATSAASGAASAPSSPQIMLNVQPNARGDIPMETFQGLVGEINRGLGRGGRIVGGAMA